MVNRDRPLLSVDPLVMRPTERRIVWPGWKDSALTVFDDTDLATVSSVRPVYELLAEQGVFVTKSVWPLRNHRGHEPARAGMDCEDLDYLQWVLGLQAQGFEIGRTLKSYPEMPYHDPAKP